MWQKNPDHHWNSWKHWNICSSMQKAFFEVQESWIILYHGRLRRGRMISFHQLLCRPITGFSPLHYLKPVHCNPKAICIISSFFQATRLFFCVQPTASSSHSQLLLIHSFSSLLREREREGCVGVGCLTSQQQASVSQGRICSDNFTCCHTEIEVADPTFYLTQSQYTDTGPTSPSADPITPGVWQGSHWSANF